MLLCIQTGKTMSDPASHEIRHRRILSQDRAKRWRSCLAKFPEALERTWDIAQRCHVKLETVQNSFPNFEVPEGHTIDTYFEYVARQGFENPRAASSRRAQGRLAPSTIWPNTNSA